MNIQTILAFSKAFESHKTCINYGYYRVTAARELVTAYESMLIEADLGIKVDAKASNAIDLLREAMGEMRDANGYMEQALAELYVPLADSIVRLNTAAPEPVVMATTGVEYVAEKAAE